MQASTLWWIVAGLLVASELTTGTFYLLVLALAAAVGAVAAHLGLGPTAQVTLAALTGALGTSGWYVYRRRHRQEPNSAQADRNLNLDIGNVVQVTAWNEQGEAQVQHRGAVWLARHTGADAPRPGPHRIKSLNGNTLELEPTS